MKKIAVMFSGGADSTLMLDLALREYGEDCVTAVYVNFGGQSTGSELSTVLKTANRLNVRINIHFLTVGDDKKGPEGNARLKFKPILNQYLDSDAYDEVWIGHNRDDHIETVLIQLFRGAGAGSKGIPDQRQGKLFRPILNMTRDEIREECVARGLEFYEDPMNTDQSLTRAFFRNEIIPKLKEHYGEKSAYKRIDTISKRFM